MPITFDEVTAIVQPPTPPADGPPRTVRERPSDGTDPLELTRLFERLAERAARLNAD